MTAARVSGARVLGHLVRADFLDRVRRYSFLITLGFSVYLGYAVYRGQVSLQLGDYRGVNNAAWLGALIGLVASVWIPLVGFYVVKNSIQRDRETRVGQILASTPMSKGFYTAGKALSNFAVLALVVLILAAAAVVIQVAGHPQGPLSLFALLSPILLFGLGAVSITASLAVLFESLPVLRGGVGNVIYFFLWIGLIMVGVGALEMKTDPSPGTVLADTTGIGTVMGQMQAEVRRIDAGFEGGGSFSVGGLTHPKKSFVWTGMVWTPLILLGRMLHAVVAVMLALLAAVFFDRFDPARAGGASGAGRKKKAKRERGQAGLETLAVRPSTAMTAGQMTAGQMTAGRLTRIAQGPVRTPMAGLVQAELRLMLKGQRWWWYAVAAGLWIGCVASPLEAARGGVLLAAWLWPLLLWSQMGAREMQRPVGMLVFSAPRAASRQLLAVYGAGVLVAMATGGGVGVRLLLAADWVGLAAWTAGALFIPALALALGVMSGTRKAFEALYTMAWYVGPPHHIRGMDFMGTTAGSSTPAAFGALALVLVMVAYGFRRARLATA